MREGHQRSGAEGGEGAMESRGEKKSGGREGKGDVGDAEGKSLTSECGRGKCRGL